MINAATAARLGDKSSIPVYSAARAPLPPEDDDRALAIAFSSLFHPTKCFHEFRILQTVFIHNIIVHSLSRMYFSVCSSFRFMVVLVCLIFSVLSTIEEYEDFANETLFWMVRSSFLAYFPKSFLPNFKLLALAGFGLRYTLAWEAYFATYSTQLKNEDYVA